MKRLNDRCTCQTKWPLFFCRLILFGVLFSPLAGCDSEPPITHCPPTPYDEIGPFYRPGAPIRDKVGEGFLLRGRVVSTDHCRVLPKSRIEFWLVNEEGQYDESHRATVFSDRQGRYHFESNRPSDYVGRLPHIHIMVTAQGHEQLITQYYPQEGESEALFNLVLEPDVP